MNSEAEISFIIKKSVCTSPTPRDDAMPFQGYDPWPACWHAQQQQQHCMLKEDWSRRSPASARLLVIYQSQSVIGLAKNKVWALFKNTTKLNVHHVEDPGIDWVKNFGVDSSASKLKVSSSSVLSPPCDIEWLVVYQQTANVAGNT